ncbi:MAG: zinc-ribbon domain-containing protein [Pseudomonadota bacterium]
MRITCPNCNAQYEIAEGVIPIDGRDVQCSNCGTTWFQEGRTAEATEAEAPEFVPNRRPPLDEATRGILREEREREEALRGAAPPAPEKLPDDWDDEEDDAPRAAPEPVDERARLAAAASVARARDKEDDDAEEDAKETEGMRDAIVSALRAARTVDLEDHPADAKRAAAQPSAPSGPVSSQTKTRVLGAAEADRFGNVSDSSDRRGLLPDIEKINSSLRPDEMETMEPVVEMDGEDEGRGGGFRFGFLVACLVILLPVVVYLFAEPIKSAVPQTAETISAYQLWVDARRVDLEAGVEALTDRLTTPQS